MLSASLPTLAQPALIEALQKIVRDPQVTAITVYNNLALIKDQRQTLIEPGLNQLLWRQVSPQLIPQSVLVRTEKSQPLTLVEHFFDSATLTPDTLLQSAIGQKLLVIRTNPNTGGETREPAVLLLSAAQGAILQFPDRIEIATPQHQLAFKPLPANLANQPTLGEYHLYTFDYPVTLDHQQTK